MEKVWLKSYPEGIPEFVDLDRYSSLAHMFDECAERYRHLPAFANMGVSLSFSELNIDSYNFAAYLQTELGLEKGNCVAIMLPNILQFPVAMYGTLRAGMAAVNINPMYTSRELGEALKGSDAKVIVILENFAGVLDEVVRDTRVEHVILTRAGDMLGFPKSAVVNFVLKHMQHKIPDYALDNTVLFRKVLAIGQQRQFVKPELNHDDVAFLQLTGGTTGLAKQAILTHGNVLSNLAQVEAWFRLVLDEGKETVITALPLYHIFSLMANCFLFTCLGGLNYLITNPRDMKGFVRELRRVRFSSDYRCEHPVQWAAEYGGFFGPGFFTPQDHVGRRHGSSGGRGTKVAASHGLCAVRGLRAYGDFTRSDDQSLQPGLVQWFDRAANPEYGGFHTG